MERVKNWTAKRAGGRITIYGFDAEDSSPVRICHVDAIAVDEKGIVATDDHGEEYLLEPQLVSAIAA
jgi:hypothetical protein